MSEGIDTCKGLVDRAFNACASGIHKAQDQCLGVMGALGTVYHHARVVLDRINPGRWSTKQNAAAAAGGSAGAAQQLHKRQALSGDDRSVMDEIELSASDRDICEPLDTLMVCHSLNDSEFLCQPSRWAGEAIQDAINATQIAMSSLQGALQFYVTSEPYSNTRHNASTLTFQIRQRVQEEFAAKTAYFQLIIGLLQKLVPLALILLIYSAYVHIKLYMSRDTYDNIYVSQRLQLFDEHHAATAKMSLSEGGILPLKRYERCYLVDTTTNSLAVPEIGRYRVGLCVLFLHLLLSVSCYTFDYVLYWVLSLVKRHGRPGFDPTGGDSLELVLTGEGIIVELLDVFLKGFHTNHGFSFVGDTQACLPQPRRPSGSNLLVLFFLYVVLLATILLKAYILRIRSRVTGYFYQERQMSRLRYLYEVIMSQRARLPRILHHAVRTNYHASQMYAGGGGFLDCLRISGERVKRHAKQPDSFCRVGSSRCLVCGLGEDSGFRECETESCYGLYCRECFDDLQRVCPLCFQYTTGGSAAATACNDNFEFDDDGACVHASDAPDVSTFNDDEMHECQHVSAAHSMIFYTDS